jgi:hypothetical protein
MVQDLIAPHHPRRRMRRYGPSSHYQSIALTIHRIQPKIQNPLRRNPSDLLTLLRTFLQVRCPPHHETPPRPFFRRQQILHQVARRLISVKRGGEVLLAGRCNDHMVLADLCDVLVHCGSSDSDTGHLDV